MKRDNLEKQKSTTPRGMVLFCVVIRDFRLPANLEGPLILLIWKASMNRAAFDRRMARKATRKFVKEC